MRTRPGTRSRSPGASGPSARPWLRSSAASRPSAAASPRSISAVCSGALTGSALTVISTRPRCSRSLSIARSSGSARAAHLLEAEHQIEPAMVHRAQLDRHAIAAVLAACRAEAGHARDDPAVAAARSPALRFMPPPLPPRCAAPPRPPRPPAGWRRSLPAARAAAGGRAASRPAPRDRPADARPPNGCARG